MNLDIFKLKILYFKMSFEGNITHVCFAVSSSLLERFAILNRYGYLNRAKEKTSKISHGAGTNEEKRYYEVIILRLWCWLGVNERKLR